jgi:hypothetical protein
MEETSLFLYVNDNGSIEQGIQHQKWWNDDHKRLVDKDLEADRCGLFQGIILAYSWEEWIRSSKSSVRTANSLT